MANGDKVPVSSRAVGWLTGAFVALGGTAAVLLWEHPRTNDVRLLIVGGMLLSGVVGGWTARSMFGGAVEPRAWSVAAPCMVMGAFMGACAFLFLCAIAVVGFAIVLAHSHPAW